MEQIYINRLDDNLSFVCHKYIRNNFVTLWDALCVSLRQKEAIITVYSKNNSNEI